ncbi:MAG TPA: retroviral-like aspartic protease family protein [Candidatus Limnocylindria bacterium]|nr:retroviral-like aspartic protease family protein [Candidatus Limnocylindria bacterium]
MSWLLIWQAQAAKPPADPLAEFLGKLGYLRVELTRVPTSRRDWVAEGNELFLDARVEGRKERWLLDTGCSVTCLSPSAAKQLKSLAELHLRVKDPVLGTVGGADFALIHKLQLGPMLLENQPVQIGNLDGRQFLANKDALLGIDLLRRNYALVDFPGRGLFLSAQEPTAENIAALDEVLRRSGWSAVPLVADRSFWLFAEVRVQGQPYRFLVDSGCTFTQLDLTVAKQLGLKLDRMHLTTAGIGNRLADTYQARVPLMQLAGLSLTNAPVAVTDLTPWQSGHGPLIDGVIGADWLGLGRGVMDCHARRLYLTPLYEPKKH